MPMLSVSELLLDPDFADEFSVVRRSETLSTTGRSIQSSRTYTGVIGVVIPTTPNELDREDSYEVMNRSITVLTKFRLRGEVTNQQPDVVVWRGDNYVVKAASLFVHFGQGYVKAECLSMDRTDAPIDLPVPGQLSFNVAANSGVLVNVA